MKVSFCSIASLVVLFFFNTISFAQGESEQLARFENAANDQFKASVVTKLENALAIDGIEGAIDLFDLMYSEPIAYAINEREMTTLGTNLLLAGKNDESAAIFQLVAQTYPNSWQALENLGNAYLVQGKQTTAEQCFDKATELKGNNDLEQDNAEHQPVVLN